MQKQSSARPRFALSPRRTFALVTCLLLVGYLLGVITRAPAAPQVARPVSDASTTFVNPPSWDKVDEATPDGDTTFAQSKDSAFSWFDSYLSPLTDPQVNTGHVVRATFRKSAAGGIQTDVRVRVRQFDAPTIVAERTFTNINEVYATNSFTLTGAEADSIVNYGALRLQVLIDFIGTGTTRHVRVTQVEMEVPEVGGPPPPTSPPPPPPPGGCTPTVDVTGTQANGFTVPAGACWSIGGLVTTPKNVLVYGTLQMRAGDTLRFTGINEANYVGGGNFSSTNPPPASEVGLFVLDAGVLDAQGTPRVAWNRTGDDPTWLTSDELRVAPIAAGEFGTADFAPWTKGNLPPTARADLPRAEVLNLTRDVVIEGNTAEGRSHIYIRSSAAQIIKYVLIRHVGPRINGFKVLGRWGLHVHQPGVNNAPYTIQGVVVRDAGSHAFVLHGADSITLRETIAYDVQESAYWWDPGTAADMSHGILYDRAVAAKVYIPNNQDPRSAGFTLSDGGGNAIIGGVAVGVHGAASDATGYHWPNNGPNWVLNDSVAHNSEPDCHSVWENANDVKVINNFIGYRCQRGNNQGAYNPSYIYNGGIFALMEWAALEQHAVNPGNGRDSKYVGVKFDGLLQFVNTNLPAGAPYLFLDVTGVTQVQVNNQGQAEHVVDFVACTADHALEPGDFVITNIRPDEVYRVQRLNGTAFKVTAAGTTTIGAFYTC